MNASPHRRPLTAAERQRRLRARARDGGYLVTLWLPFEVIDALETIRGANIDCAGDAAAALGEELARWAMAMDRLKPRRFSPSRRDGPAGAGVVEATMTDSERRGP